MNSKSFYAVAAIASLAAVISTGAQADEADGSQHVLKFEGNRTRAEVRAEAVQAVRLGLTSHGEIGTYAVAFEGSRSRAEVRTEAIQAARLGLTSHGEVGIYALTFDGSHNRAAAQAEAVQAKRLGLASRDQVSPL